ncbi:MAG: glucosamine-6-phosphate deaminase [Phycisphaerales bacterium]|nr:glucosamine-6-phosphate deaminase [Phycisphaerales bacterium]
MKTNRSTAAGVYDRSNSGSASKREIGVVYPIGPSDLAKGIEKIPVTVFSSSGGASKAVAREIAEVIRSRAAAGKKAVLGLATGSTPQGVYEELVRLHEEEGLSFSNVVTFNLDEYWPMRRDELQSYNRFMREYLFDHIDIRPENIHIPDGTIAMEETGAFCERYERLIQQHGGIDLQILGIGRTGHIGFNEPGSPRDSRTRLITLDRVTRIDAASDFFGEWNVPRKAITMGVGTILAAKKVVLLAFGEHKAGVIKRAVEGEISTHVAASFLQEHPSAKMYLDPSSAAELTRFKTPWMLAEMSQFSLKWDTQQTKKAVIWLARTLSKPILKLTEEDYNEHGLQELLSTRRGGAYDINIEVFRALQGTITGWPGGKPLEKGRGERREVARALAQSKGAEVFPKKVVVFSPHPDDDVISMGGTFIRLCEQGHEVHVAYQTSGNIAVFDENAVRHTEFAAEFCRAFKLFGGKEAQKLEDKILSFVKTKEPGEIDSPELQVIKGLIRRTEARSGARYSGVKPQNIHFLDLPFYETGRVKKKPLGEDDIKITMDLLEKVKPNQIYAAGDLSDPHGTHRVCLAAVVTAVHRLKDRPWMKQCEVWLYRGAWQEWEPHEIEMAVPLSPDEVARKRMAIFKHESQKDRALFPGPDSREFWQRAEERNKATAAVYDTLGLPEYQAIEGFVRWKPSEMDNAIVEIKASKKGKALHSGLNGVAHRSGKPSKARTH